MKKPYCRTTLFGAGCFSGVLAALVLVTAACAPQTQVAVPEPSRTPTVTSQPTRTPTPSPSPTPTSATPPAHLAVAPEDLAGISITFVHPWTGAMADTLESAAAAFSLSNPWDIWVDVEAPGGEMALLDQLTLDLANNQVPGLIAAHPYQLASLDGDYYAVSLTDYFYHPEWGFSSEARLDIPPVFLDGTTHNGHLVALPVAPQATVLFINQTWAESLGNPSLPESAQGFQELACEGVFANNADYDPENDGTGGWLVNLAPPVLGSWYRAFEGDLVWDGAPSFDNPAGEAAFGYLKSAYDQGCFWIGRRMDPYYYFADRLALAYAGTLEQIPIQTAWMAAEENEDAWTVMGFPGPAGETILVGGPGLSVTADTPERQMAAWLFARHLLDPEIQADLSRSGFSLPVRKSALPLLEDLMTSYPQWGLVAEKMEQADALPISESWGMAQWVLQDAVLRLLQVEADQLPGILEDLDATIIELEEMAP